MSVETFEHAGLTCLVATDDNGLTVSLAVIVPDTHPLAGKSWEEAGLPELGGNRSAHDEGEGWHFSFDASHTRSQAWLERGGDLVEEVKQLAEALADRAA